MTSGWAGRCRLDRHFCWGQSAPLSSLGCFPTSAPILTSDVTPLCHALPDFLIFLSSWNAGHLLCLSHSRSEMLLGVTSFARTLPHQRLPPLPESLPLSPSSFYCSFMLLRSNLRVLSTEHFRFHYLLRSFPQSC